MWLTVCVCVCVWPAVSGVNVEMDWLRFQTWITEHYLIYYDMTNLGYQYINTNMRNTPMREISQYFWNESSAVASHHISYYTKSLYRPPVRTHTVFISLWPRYRVYPYASRIIKAPGAPWLIWQQEEQEIGKWFFTPLLFFFFLVLHLSSHLRTSSL